MRADSPMQEPSLEVANNQGQSIRDTTTDIEAMLQRIEDFLSGPRPEKEHGGAVESCPSGILAQMCQLGNSNLDRLQDIHRRLDRMAANLGVQR
jgi:hypothetical protein